MKNRVCIIVPHFGRFQNYFQLFLKTCSYNPNFNWLIITDDGTSFDYPSNVMCIQKDFKQFKEEISSKFNFPISLDRPYKLCDYRPLYGYMFAEYLEGFTHWGHCDTDVIMGNLGKFINDDLLDSYDKIFRLGHLSIYRNTSEINSIALKPYQGCEIGKRILQTPKNCWFDEEWDPVHNVSINRIFEAYGKRIYKDDLSLNISFSYNRFVRGKFVGIENTSMPFGFEIEKYKDALYLWNKGNLYRYFLNKGELVREDFPYMHLQQRPMKMHLAVLQQDCFQIIPDEFIPFSFQQVITVNSFSKIPRPCKSWLKERLLWKRLKKKLHIK